MSSFVVCLSALKDPLQVIIGRTDSAQVLGMEEAVTRLKLAAAAGADVCFIEGVKTSELLKETVAALAPKPVRPYCKLGSQHVLNDSRYSLT